MVHDSHEISAEMVQFVPFDSCLSCRLLLFFRTTLVFGKKHIIDFFVFCGRVGQRVPSRHFWFTFWAIAGIVPFCRAGTGLDHDLIFVQFPENLVPASVVHVTPASRYIDGYRIVRLESQNLKLTNLTPEFASARDPEVSFDGRTIYFSGKRTAHSSWRIWEMNPDGQNKKAITQASENCMSPLCVGSLFHLDDVAPTAQIAYVSSAHGWSDPLGYGEAFALYTCRLDGTRATRITSNLWPDFDPDVLPNGRVVYSSWQSEGGRISLFEVSIDGTDLMPFYGNHEQPLIKEMVRVSSADRIYFIESDALSWLGGGDLAFVSRRRPLKTREVLSPSSASVYHTPCPLIDGSLLCAVRHDSGSFEICRLDPHSGKISEKIFGQSNWHSFDVQELVPRPIVQGRSSVVNLKKETGVFYCLNVFESNVAPLHFPDSDSVTHVRVIEGLPRRSGDQRQGDFDEGWPDPVAKRILGLVPLEADGSFHIEIPADIPVTFQLLNQAHMSVKAQSGWIWVKPKESRGCIGCHQDREMSPPNIMPISVTKPAVQLTLPEERRRTVDFIHEIAPLFEKSCACHGSEGASPPISREGDRRAWYTVYRMLLEKPIQGSPLVVPGRARDSALIHGCPNGHTGHSKQANFLETLPLTERNRLIEWIDLGASWSTRERAEPVCGRAETEGGP